jgi:DNA-binding PucR family transcriptional regulator
MDTNKAAYWIAVGVLALGLNSEYRYGGFVAVHRVAERAGSVLCRISTRAEQSLAVALGMTNRENLRAGDLLAADEGTEMARAEAEVAREQARARADMMRERVRDEIRAQADVIREQAEMERAQIEQMRWRTASQVGLARTANRRVMVVCPKTGTRITLRRGAELDDIAPDVETDDNF